MRTCIKLTYDVSLYTIKNIKSFGLKSVESYGLKKVEPYGLKNVELYRYSFKQTSSIPL